MKFLSVKKLKSLYFTVSVSLESMKYKRKFSVRKRAFISVLGIPVYSTKEIYVHPNVHDLRDVAV